MFALVAVTVCSVMFNPTCTTVTFDEPRTFPTLKECQEAGYSYAAGSVSAAGITGYLPWSTRIDCGTQGRDA